MPELSDPPQYRRVTHLIPQDATGDELLAVLALAQPRLQTVSFSADHALDTHQPTHELHVWGVERIVQPPADSLAAAQRAFIQFCRQQWGHVPEIVWHEMATHGSSLPPLAVVEPQIGLHDVGGGDWMRANRIQGFCVHSVALGMKGFRFDFTSFAQANIRTIVRLNFGFNPVGTIPPASEPQQVADFISACQQTIANSVGVWGWVIGNEPRNPAERPGGTLLSPAPSVLHYANIYNAIYRAKPAGARIAPAAVDPYFGVDGVDPLRWLQTLLDVVDDLDFVTIHAKTQGSLPQQVSSEARFNSPPLANRRLHLRAYRDVIDHIPLRFYERPLIITEANPQRQHAGNIDDPLGWQPLHAEAWMQAARDEVRGWNSLARNQIAGIVYYRWSFDPWALSTMPEALAALQILRQA